MKRAFWICSALSICLCLHEVRPLLAQETILSRSTTSQDQQGLMLTIYNWNLPRVVPSGRK